MLMQQVWLLLGLCSVTLCALPLMKNEGWSLVCYVFLRKLPGKCRKFLGDIHSSLICYCNLPLVCEQRWHNGCNIIITGSYSASKWTSVSIIIQLILASLKRMQPILFCIWSQLFSTLLNKHSSLFTWCHYNACSWDKQAGKMCQVKSIE